MLWFLNILRHQKEIFAAPLSDSDVALMKDKPKLHPNQDENNDKESLCIYPF